MHVEENVGTAWERWEGITPLLVEKTVIIVSTLGCYVLVFPLSMGRLHLLRDHLFVMNIYHCVQNIVLLEYGNECTYIL